MQIILSANHRSYYLSQGGDTCTVTQQKKKIQSLAQFELILYSFYLRALLFTLRKALHLSGVPLFFFPLPGVTFKEQRWRCDLIKNDHTALLRYLY